MSLGLLPRSLAVLALCCAALLVLTEVDRGTPASDNDGLWQHSNWILHDDAQNYSAPETTAERTVRVLVCHSEKSNEEVLRYMGQAYVWTLEQRLGGKFKLDVRVLEKPEDAPEDLGYRTFVRANFYGGLSSCITRIPLLMAHLASENRSDRVQVIDDAGEVFYGRRRCRKGVTDFMLDRSGDRPIAGNCKRLHFLQGLEFEARGNPVYALRKLCDPEFIRMVPTEPRELAILSASRVIKATYHRMDVLVRTSLFALMTEEFGPEGMAGTKWIDEVREAKPDWRRIHCKGKDLDSTACKAGYAFSLDMENEASKGYISEKIFGGLVSKTVPIYFGAPDIDKYINPRRFIHCQVKTSVLIEMRAFKQSRTFLIYSNKTRPTPAALLDWAVGRLRPHLAPCVAEVRRVHENRTLYNEMVREPPFRNQEAVCAEHPYYYMGLGDQLFDALDAS